MPDTIAQREVPDASTVAASGDRVVPPRGPRHVVANARARGAMLRSERRAARNAAGPCDDVAGPLHAAVHQMPAVLLDDALFDDQLPAQVQHHSAIHFTPIEVARFAAQLLVAGRRRARILDVGAGAGKFCLVAARTVGSATFVGVELRPHLVAIAQQLAMRQRIRNATFVHGNAFDLDWSTFDGFYFYNPFAEQQHPAVFVMDRTIELAPANFDHYVAQTRSRLQRASRGTRVVTYHGLGAALPDGYSLQGAQLVHGGMLELWEQTAPTP